MLIIGLKGDEKCSIPLGFEACQVMEVTPGWIFIHICLFELSQNLLISGLYFLKFHYEVIVIFPLLMIVNWI